MIQALRKAFKLDTPIKAPAETEKAWSNYSFFANNTNFEQYNPDQLVARKGAEVYSKMLDDSQVKSAFQLVLDIVVSREFRFIPADDSPVQEEIIEFYNYNLEKFLKGTFLQAMRGILMAKAYGYSVTEKIYEATTINGKPVWMVRALKLRAWDSFTFEHDVFGNLKTLVQWQNGVKKKLDPSKFIVFVANAELDPIWGRSDFKAAYRPYWEKQIGLNFWNIYLERLAGGFMVAKPTTEGRALSAKEKVDFENTLRNVTKQTAMRLPFGWDLEVTHGQNTDAFEKFSIHKDKQIAKALLVPNLLGFSETGQTGSFAQSKTQLEMFLNIINFDGDLLADTLNECLFKELAVWNFGVEDHPRMKFEKFTTEQKSAIAEAWSDAVQKGTVVNTFQDEQRTRSLLTYDEREQSEEAEQTTNNSIKKSFADASSVPMRVPIKRINDLMDDDEEQFISDLSKHTDRYFSFIRSTVEEIVSNTRKKGLETAEESELDKLNRAIPKRTQDAMVRDIKANLRNIYNDSRDVAEDELKVSLEGAPADIKKGIRLTNKRAIIGDWSVADFVEGLRPTDLPLATIQAGFTISGNISDTMIEKARRIIMSGISNDWSQTKIIDELRLVLPDLIGKITIDPETGQVGVDDKTERRRIETIVRTNMIDFWNQAALATYTNPNLQGWVKGLEYNAILDSRTTPFCRKYDGFKASIKSPVWSDIRPPNHFNCRSILTPATLDDAFTANKKLKREADPDSPGKQRLVQPSAGFGTVDAKKEKTLGRGL